MSWKLVEIEQNPSLPEKGRWPVGTCFKVPVAPGKTILDHVVSKWRGGLGVNFLASGRSYVWAIVMPHDTDNLIIWVPDIRQGRWEFTLTGDSADNMTVTPKVDIDHQYFGSITDGYITDDELSREYNW